MLRPVLIPVGVVQRLGTFRLRQVVSGSRFFGNRQKFRESKRHISLRGPSADSKSISVFVMLVLSLKVLIWEN